MRSVSLMISMAVFLITGTVQAGSSNQRIEMKYLGRTPQGTVRLLYTGNEALSPGIEGFLMTRLIVNKAKLNLPIARFVIKTVTKKEIFVDVIRWGEGWRRDDIQYGEISGKDLRNFQEFQKLMYEGKRKYASSDFPGAHQDFLSALELQPSSRECMNWLSRTGAKTNQSNAIINRMGFPTGYERMLANAQAVYRNPSGNWEVVLQESIGMVYVPSGSFIQGSDARHEDEIPPKTIDLKDYWISKTEVTLRQYEEFARGTGRQMPDDEGYNHDRYPVMSVTWFDAREYCLWLSRKTGLAFQLPTEAQWEKAARGDSDERLYPWGFQDNGSGGIYYCNSKENKEDGFEYLAPVDAFPIGASPYGVLQMAGNIAEWVRDWYDPAYYSQKHTIKDPKGPSSGTQRVVRGGSYVDFDFATRVSKRDAMKPDEKNNYTGFRVVLDEPSGEKDK